MTFDDAFVRLIGHEGGYTAGTNDPGGETKYGISKRAYPREDIKGLTLERAKEIYARDYWGPAGCDAVPDAIRFDLFDAAVNSGPRQAIMFLQKACRTVPDGMLGPVTLQAAGTMNPARLVARFNGVRLAFMVTLGNWKFAGAGWANRIASNLMEA